MNAHANTLANTLANTNAHVPAGIAAPSPEALAYRAAMRKLAGAVSVLTVGYGEDRTGLTATSVSSLSIEPPTLIISVNSTASAASTLERYRSFAINVLRNHHVGLADDFSGKTGLKGAQRYQGGEWIRLTTGAPVLADALASFDCDVEEIIPRHSHLIVIGRVVASRITEAAEPLLYWSGSYRQFGA